jgi:hypothetical protein
MSRVAVLLLLLLTALAAGCGGGKKASPEYALLTGVRAHGDSVVFTFASAPRDVKTRYVPRGSLVECGSGAPVALQGTTVVAVHFLPAMTARIEGDTVTPTYTGPKRLEAPGPVLEVVKTCDFEADVGWAVGLSRRLPLDVSRDGSTVTIAFG